MCVCAQGTYNFRGAVEFSSSVYALLACAGRAAGGGKEKRVDYFVELI
jgi:hypothetical protein